jgi:hypothetical protein
LGQNHLEKRHEVLICDTQQESHQETPPTNLHENPKKKLRKSPGRISGNKRTQDEPRQNFYTCHKRFIHGVPSCPNILPSLKMNHEALMLAYGKPKGKGKTVEANELGFQELTAIPHLSSLYRVN